MKRAATTFLISLNLCLSLYADFKEFSILTEPKWHNLEKDSKKNKKFGGKWMLIGSITFKKKAREDIVLDKIYLQWNGNKIKHLLGSLYKKNPDKEFLAIEDNLLCDGAWSEKKQKLVFRFNKEQHLGPVNIFYVVLTVPENIEPAIKKGSFTIEKKCLPEQFKVALKRQSISLAQLHSSSEKV